MSTPSAVPRTAPIAIAPKPASSRFTPSSRQGSIHTEAFPGSLVHSNSGEFDTPDSVGSPANGIPTWPCEACQRRRIKCLVMGDDDEGCTSCQANGTECSLVGSPAPRKRKLNGDFDGEGRSKRRYARHSYPLIGARGISLKILIPHGLKSHYRACAGTLSTWKFKLSDTRLDNLVPQVREGMITEGDGTNKAVFPALLPAARSLKRWPTLAVPRSSSELWASKGTDIVSTSGYVFPAACCLLSSVLRT